MHAAHRPGSRRLLGIVGPPGCGKSHLAGFLARHLNHRASTSIAAVVAMDGFHLANDVLERLGRRHRKGAPDTFDVDGFVHLLDRLCTGTDRAVYAPRFDRELDEPINAALAIEPHAELLFVEGNYLLVRDDPWAGIADRLDLVLFVDTPDAVRHRRLVERHRRTRGSTGAALAWIDRVDQPNADLVSSTRWRADLYVTAFPLPGPRLR